MLANLRISPEIANNGGKAGAGKAGCPRASVIYFETIRDVQATFPVPPNQQMVPLAELEARVVYHEVLHQFVGAHGARGADDGIMLVANGLFGDGNAIKLTPLQIRLIQEKSSPQ